jgi:hypothetical protein
MADKFDQSHKLVISELLLLMLDWKLKGKSNSIANGLRALMRSLLSIVIDWSEANLFQLVK